MSNNQSASLYVGDLTPEVTESILFELFNHVGPVASIRVCRDTITKRSLGYAYINFHSSVDAERALDTLNNTPICDRPCRIMWVQRDPSIRKSGLGNIFIKNLDTTIGHKELYDTFSIFGNILSCKVAQDENAQSKGYGFVHFESAESAETAVKMVNGKVMRTKQVFVGKFVPKKDFMKQKESSWTNVYFKDIDPTIDEEPLKQLVAQKVSAGDLSAITSCVIMKDENNASRGFGFVNFANHELAVQAVKMLHGTNVGEKVIWVGRAQKMEERQQELKKKFNLMKMERLSKYQGSNLYVKNIEDEINQERLIKEFSPFGSVKSCKLVVDDQGAQKGFGFVCFSSPDEAQRAITEMHGRILQGCNKPLYVALHEPADIRKQKIAQKISSKQMRPLNYVGGPQGMYAQPVFYGANISNYGYPPQVGRQPGWVQQHPVPNYMYSQRGKGRGGRGRGGHAVSQVQKQDPSILHVSHMPPVIGLQQIMGLPVEQQKVALGERLYPLIYKSQPHLCGKITGMFLDSGWPVEELYSLIEDENKLNQKVEQALEILTKAQDSPAENAEQAQPVEAN